MENLFESDPHQEAMLWLAEELPIVNKSDFVRYTQQPMNFVSENSRNITRNVNMKKRMIEFLKKSWEPQVSNAGISNEKERAYKHMINERMRREKQKKNYQALHKILPLGTKDDKSSIIQMATKRIEELQRYKKELRRQNYGLEVRLQQHKNTTTVPVLLTTNLGSGEVERAHITFNVVSPPSGIECMLEVLKCLKNTNDTRAIAIQSSFSSQKFSAQFEIETKIGTAEVEKAVNATLWKVGKKYHINSSEFNQIDTDKSL